MPNVVAHQWLSSSTYDFALDTRIGKGWEKNGADIRLNPQLFYDAFKAGFSAHRRVWGYAHLLTEEAHQAAKDRLLKKYITR